MADYVEPHVYMEVMDRNEDQSKRIYEPMEIEPSQGNSKRCTQRVKITVTVLGVLAILTAFAVYVLLTFQIQKGKLYLYFVYIEIEI